MRWYVARRVAWAVVATYLIVSITFVLVYITPDTGLIAFQFQAASEGQTAEEAAKAYERARGLDRPVYELYIDYMVNMFTLNWGWSHTRSQPVLDSVVGALPYSMMYGIPATIISTFLGIVIGLYSATHQYTKTDYAATFFAFFGLSIPNFWFAIILLLVCGVFLGWVPVVFDPSLAKESGRFTIAAMASWPNVRQYLLPTIVLLTASIASLMRYSRAEALEYVKAEFVKTAKSKGATGRTILYKHILRPAAVPLTTILVGDILGIIFVASYLVEVVFGIPGLGQLSYQAIIQQDTPLVMATVLVPTFVAIVGNLMQDIAYTVLDPRIDYGDR